MKLLFTRKDAATICIGAVLSTALLFSGMGNAMPIPQYDGMDKHDQTRYVTLLIKGTHDHLSANGQSAQAERVLYLFENSSTKFGWPQFERNLHMARVLNAKHAADPNNKKAPYEVEQALSLTLQNNGILVPVTFLTDDKQRLQALLSSWQIGGGCLAQAKRSSRLLKKCVLGCCFSSFAMPLSDLSGSVMVVFGALCGSLLG